MTLPVILAFVLDLWIGDPPWLISRIGHPIIWMGKGITFTESKLRQRFKTDNKSLLWAGRVLLLTMIVSSLLITYGLLWCASLLSHHATFLVETFLCYQLLATRSLQVESMKVYHCLEQKDLEKSRLALSYLVGRDTTSLSEEGIRKATVETIAENTTDAVVAPLFYMCLFGVMGGVCYKVVNTLDSMVGYHNYTYEYFGRASAKCDDVLNFLPARLSAFFLLCLIPVLSPFLSLDFRNALSTFLRDRFAHSSPNSAQTESVVAGGLWVELGGNATYFGVVHMKPTIGVSARPISNYDIIITNHWMIATSCLACGVFAMIPLVHSWLI